MPDPTSQGRALLYPPTHSCLLLDPKQGCTEISRPLINEQQVGLSPAARGAAAKKPSVPPQPMLTLLLRLLPQGRAGKTQPQPLPLQSSNPSAPALQLLMGPGPVPR